MIQLPRLLSAIILLSLALPFSLAQESARIDGTLTDENGEVVMGANIVIKEALTGVVTNQLGYYEITLPGGRVYTMEISFLGYEKHSTRINLPVGATITYSFKLSPSAERLDEVTIEGRFPRLGTIERIDIKTLNRVTSQTGGIEAVLGTMGASIRSDFSSQYSVRGGNFDENLVYINGIEVYRPLLIKAGQQEGLSIINTDLVSSIQFSSGGFDAQYGDKMSSMLDIRYKRPVRTGGSASGSLTGATMHFETASADKKLTAIAGARYKSNRYMLNRLNTTGDYRPSFYDFQAYLTYSPIKQIEISLLGNISQNKYWSVPTEESTDFGTFRQQLNFTVYYDGQEIDRFQAGTGALSIDIMPGKYLHLKQVFSLFNTYEEITYDLDAQYWINSVDVNIQEMTRDSAVNIGVGTFLKHARNFLDGQVLSYSHTGNWFSDNTNLKWGVALQSHTINDNIREWELIDSVGYSTPFSPSQVLLSSSRISKNRISSNRLTAFIQSTNRFETSNAIYLLNIGLRSNYMSLTNQLVFSPRIILSALPYWNEKIKFHAAWGYYYQPPFYKEFLKPSGELNLDIKAQKSVHYVAGGSYNFEMWERPFIVSGELYYKHLWNLIPYKLEDVNIQYLPNFIARGYATGIEFKINGEFVKDAQSWATITLLRTREDIYRDYYLLPDRTVVTPGYYRRPTDQLLNFGMFFRDYFPNNPEYKVNLTMMFGTNLPFGVPDYTRPDRTVNMIPYQRVDIGISKSLTHLSMFSNLQDIWFTLEAFNVFNRQNQIAYRWVKTVENNEGFPNIFGIKSLSTGFILNARLNAAF